MVSFKHFRQMWLFTPTVLTRQGVAYIKFARSCQKCFCRCVTTSLYVFFVIEVSIRKCSNLKNMVILKYFRPLWSVSQQFQAGQDVIKTKFAFNSQSCFCRCTLIFVISVIEFSKQERLHLLSFGLPSLRIFGRCDCFPQNFGQIRA